MNRIAILLFLIMFVLTKKNLKEASKEKNEDHKTVVEANHFYSNYERNTTYEINGIEKNKSLILLLKNGGKTDKQLKQNPITITLLSGDKTESCVFKSFSNICGIKKVQNENMSMKIQCKNAPCQLSWIIYQPPVLSEDGKHGIQTFVEVNKDYDHATIIVACNDPNIKTFSKDINLYTNSAYTKVENSGIVYYLFNNEARGYYYITTENEGARKCANAVLKHSSDQIQLNKNDQVLQDFLIPNKSNQYILKKAPEYDFRMDAFFHTAKGSKLSSKEGLVISLLGEKGSNKVSLSSVRIEGEDRNSVDFSAIFKKPTQKYDNLVISINPIGSEILIVDMNFASSERQEVNLGESTYFKLNKGQTLSFKLLPQTQETSQQKLTHIFSSDDKIFVTSVKECKTKFGCEFSLQAKETGEGDLYFGEQAEKNVSEVIMIDFKDKFTKKMREGQKVYMKTNIKGKQAVQAVVNSPNVIIYAAKKGKCDLVSQQCHEKVLNFHNPIIYESKNDVQVIFVAQALDICQFTLTLINEGSEYIELHDTQPFTYLFDDSEKDLEFRFNLTTKQDVHFNLIAPADELLLTVYNEEEVPDSEGEISNEGYITFNKDDIHGLSFVIKVSKKQAFLNKYIHFTILVSTKQGNVRLQPGVAQFQTIPTEQSRDFVFEFQPSKQILLNFYTHNLVDADINVVVQVSTTDDYDKQDEINEFTLDSQSDVVDIKEVAKKLCKQNAGENCELFVRIINKMEVEIDLTVTLMIEDTIIELKDGIWGSYQINKVAQNTHFYFLPKNKNRSITILFKSDLIDLKLMYTVWKTDDKSINPSQWPFPTEVKGDNQKTSLLFFTPTKFIHIDSDSLKNCWPNCVVLISTFKDQNSLKGRYNSFLQQSHFKILASSNYIQIPEKQKIDIILKKEESKHLLVDLKYVLDKEALTFFTYFTIGSVKLSGNVYSDSNPRCPVPDEPSDFKFGNLQTQIAMTSVKKRLEQNKMQDDKNPYLCILAEAFIDSKFSIQFISDQGLIKQLMLDSFSTQKSDKPDDSYFQIDGTQEFTIKISRSSGFPYIDHVICKSGNDFEDCLQTFKTTKKNEVQLADKMTTITQTPCEKCIVFLKIHSNDPYQVNIHVQSKYSQTELIQNQLITDELVQKGENKYLITSIKREEIIINIQIIHGDLQVNLFDFNGVNLTKTNQKGSTNIHIVIPPKEKSVKNNEWEWGTTFLGYFDYSTFTTFHMTIKSQNASATALYTITYSSGDPEIYLQDGLISQYALLPEKATKFLYKNPSLSKIYLHISMVDGQMLNKLKVKIIAVNNQNDQDSGVEITPQTPSFKKKTANPTMIMHLPANKFFLIEITNPSKDIELVTLGVNNQQIIYLPFNHELPVQLGKGEHTYLVINVPFETYLSVAIKKCDEGSLRVAYTTSYEEFVKEEFSYEQVIGEEELITDLLIKTKKTGSAYVKIESPPDEDSLVTVKASYSFIKNKTEKIRPGNKGVVQYKLAEAPNYQLSFTPLNCPTSDKNCSKDFTYSSIASGKVQDIYAQLVCDSIAFDLEDRRIIAPLTPAPITSQPKDGKITMQHKLAGNSQYIGVKAVNTKTGEVVYYRPVQLSTVWGQLAKGSKSLRNILTIFFSVFLLCTILICYRRRKRNMYEYTPLQGLD